MSRLVDIRLDDSALPPPTPEVEQERRVAIFDLLEANVFRLAPRDGAPPVAGPYRLDLSVREGRLVFELSTEAGAPAGAFRLSLAPFQQVVKDYFGLCAAYFDAVRRLPPSRIEAIDTARRSVHNEGGEILLERLKGEVETDIDTARRLFTLICGLHFHG